MTYVTPLSEPGSSTDSQSKATDSTASTTSITKKQQTAKQQAGASAATVTGEGRGQVEFTPVAGRRQPTNKPERALLDRAMELVEDIESLDGPAMALTIESLRFVTCELWKSVAACSQFHQSVLAIVETLVRSTEAITPGQAAALRGAFRDLAGPALSEAHLDVIHSQFIDEGYNPLAAFSRMEEADGTAEGTTG